MYQKINISKKNGIKKISIISPGFVTDCLETLDEIKNEAFETMKAYDDGDFLRYALRTTAQQSANLTLAIATAGTASGLGLTSAMTKAAIGGTFGLTSGTQTYRDLNIARTDLVREANQQQAIAKRAFDNGTIGLYEYNSIMKDTNNTIAMNDLSDGQIVGASIANGLVEGIYLVN